MEEKPEKKPAWCLNDIEAALYHIHQIPSMCILEYWRKLPAFPHVR
jgi:hypothetical protein